MLGIFHLWGRSPELKALDCALRQAGLHPQTVPEAVKLTAVQLLKRETGANPPEAAYDTAAQLIGYCTLGREEFIASNGLEAAKRAENRLEGAIAAGDSPDAKLVLLSLHSGVIAPEVVERFGLEAEGRE